MADHTGQFILEQRLVEAESGASDAASIAAFYYQRAARVGYYRGGKKDKEIDIVVDYPNVRNILIEVKYREQAPVPDEDAIIELCDEGPVLPLL